VLASSLLTDFWWFAQVGHAGVFWRILLVKAEILDVVGASATLLFAVTLRAASRRVGRLSFRNGQCGCSWRLLSSHSPSI